MNTTRHSGRALKPVAAALLLAFSGSAWAADTFNGLGTLGGTNSGAIGVSADGGVVVGWSDITGNVVEHPFRWTSGGMADLGSLGGTLTQANGVSADGAVVVGHSWTAGNATVHAFRWTSSGMTDIGTIGGTYSYAWGVSADGSVVVGESASHAFRWTSGGMVDLGTLGGSLSTAYGVSANGAVVVGVSRTAGDVTAHAFRWTSAGMGDIGSLAGGYSAAFGVSADGSVVVGESDAAGGGTHAFRWTSSGMVDLGTLGGVGSAAFGVSADGAVVVGVSNLPFGQTAFRWTQSTGMISVAQWLAGAGVALPAGWSLLEARATNSDGSVVVGTGTNSSGNTEAWLARVSPLGSGLMNPADYTPTLAGVGTLPRSGLSLSAMSLFGAHHRPLMDSGLVFGGNCAWATADASRHDSTRTNQQLAEAGLCRDAADGRWRLGAGVGVASARQGLDFGGEGKYSGQYFYAEADYAPETRRWIASLSALYGAWNTTVKRGYLNAGANDSSSGTPDATVWALRARMDWKDVARLGGFSLSPYAALTHTESRLDAYTETGGGFPARFDAQTQKADEVRLGAVAQTALSGTTDLRLNLEAANRLDGSGPGVSGQVLGLFAFSYPGADVKSSWVRAGAEIDHRLSDKSLFSASLMTASTGEDATWGVSVGYKRAF